MKNLKHYNYTFCPFFHSIIPLKIWLDDYVSLFDKICDFEHYSLFFEFVTLLLFGKSTDIIIAPTIALARPMTSSIEGINPRNMAQSKTWTMP